MNMKKVVIAGAFKSSVLAKVQQLGVGKHNDVPSNQFNPHELAMGLIVEHEHSDNPDVIMSITLDHLAQNGRYYSILRAAGLVDEDLSGADKALAAATIKTLKITR
jgi:hypothetical protein